MERRRTAILSMWLVTGLGAIVIAIAFAQLPTDKLGASFIFLMFATLALGSRMNLQIPGLRATVSLEDSLIFLTMLLFGGEAALLVGTANSLLASTRISRKPLTIAFNSAAMACSIFVTTRVLELSFGSVVSLPAISNPAVLVAAVCVMAFVHYVVNSGLIATVGAQRANESIWLTWKNHYLWTSVGYLASGLAAGTLAKLVTIGGAYALVAVLPVIAVVYFTYSTYLKNQQQAEDRLEQDRRHLAQLRDSEKRFHSAFDYAPIGMGLVGPDGRWLQVNRALCELVGFSESELLQSNFQAITHPDDLERFLHRVKEVFEGAELAHQMEKRYVNKDGDEIWALVSISLIHEAGQKAPNLILQIQDINDRKKAEEQLVHGAFHDALTGLPNRAWFIEQLDVALARYTRNSERNFAVLFLDLDRFKVINDSMGHMFGDQLLIGIARRLRSCLRSEDLVARLGGDEFTILLSDLGDITDAIRVAERVQQHLSKPFRLGSVDTFTTASIGIALSDPSYGRPEELLRDADTAMYQAKSLGKARYVIFDPCMHVHAMNTLQIESDLRRAVDRQEFFIHYQPLVSLENGMLTGFEALVRWRHPERGLIPPSDFVPIAEETGLIIPMGRQVLREACRQMRVWQRMFNGKSPLSISVNLSSKQFGDPNLLSDVVRILQTTGLDPRCLKLEITESVVMENIEAATGMLEQLRRLGVQLSIDDFGTGYSSLSYLHKLPIDTLKIDRSFVARINENNENREIVRTIILLARNLGMGVVAEGVETREQLEQLVRLQCESAQGYLFSRPVEASVASQMITNIPEWQSGNLFGETPATDDFDESLASGYRM